MKTYTPFLQLRALRVAALGFFGAVSPHAGEAGSGEFFFRDGDRAMILGDSITQQRQYSTLVESFVLSRFPEWKITFRNTGWGGDTMGLRTRKGLDAGFDRDIKPLAPTAVTIDFGMNDARAGAKGADDYVANAKKLSDKFAGIGTRVAFVTSSAEERYQEGQPAGSAYNTLLRTYSAGLQQVAAEKNLPFVDQLNPMIAVIEKGREAGVFAAKEGGGRLVPDAVHPNWDGSFVMAVYILKGLNAPSLVSSVEIDAKSGAVKAEKAKVTDVKTGDVLSFTRLDASMPWPVPSEVGNVFKVPGFTPYEDLSRYMLKVTGLTAASYRIAVDDKHLGTFSQEQLAAGLNLTGPAFRALPEIQTLLQAITAKNQLFYSRWREVQLGEIPSWVPSEAVEQGRVKRVAELDAELVVADAKLNELRKPKAHSWTLTPVN